MIYLLRHGDAEPDQGDGDPARRLTDKGRRQADAAGRALAKLGVAIDTCLASPKVRAWQTAELACAHLGIGPETCEPIAAGSYDAIELAAGRGSVLLVGHEPDMSYEVARITAARIKLKKGGLAMLEPGTLHALIRPAELAAIASGP